MDCSHARCALILFALLGYSLSAGAQAQETKKEQEQPSNSQDKVESSQPDQEKPTLDITAVPNRPTFASTAEMVQLGVFEIEYGMEAGQGHQNINGLLKWGAIKNLELWFLNNPIERDAGIAGLGDSGAGFKIKLFSQKKARPTLSLLYVGTIPTAKPQLGTGAMRHMAQLLVSKDYGRHHFDVNEGVQFVGRPGSSGFDRRYFSALSYSHPLTEKWGYTIEISGFSRANGTNPGILTLLAAPTYNFSSRLVFDSGAYYTVYGNLPHLTFFLGLTYSVVDLYHLHSASNSAKMTSKRAIP
jgi:hypothetical protein